MLPNTTAFSSAAEAIAGHCLEQFGYTPLVRPLGVMPDIVFQTSRAGEAVLALVEAKHSIVQPPKWKIEREVARFLLDVTTRAKLSSYRYEGYLIACQLRDQHIVECGCLHIDLEPYRRPGTASRPPIISGPVPPYTLPTERLGSILRLVAETVGAKDRYLSELLSEEAKQTATLKLIEEQAPVSASLVTDHIRQTAFDLGVAEQWRELEDDIGEISTIQDALVETAVERYMHPRLQEGPQDEPDPTS